MTGTERKVFQKYYPPDFDPSKIPRAKGQRNRQFVQRVMAPFNMQCNTCNEYIYKGKKFNMRRETAEGELYLGLKIFRFYFRCPNCLAEITFKTDLENCDYQQEHGATRLFEAFKLYQQEEKAKETQEEEDKKDPMKMLEKRTQMSRAEMEAIGKLEELQEINRQHEAFNPDMYLASQSMMQAEELRRQEEKDEEFIRKLYGRTADGKVIKRLVDDDSSDNEEHLSIKPSTKQIKHEPIDSGEDEKPSCSTASSSNGTAKQFSKPSTIIKAVKQEVPLPNKEPVESTQKRILAKAIIVKKKPKTEITDQKVEQTKTDVDEKVSETLHNKNTNCEKSVDLKSEKCSIESTPKPSNALLGLTDYGSDSSSD